MTTTIQPLKYKLREIKSYLIDCLGYSEEDCNDMDYQEMLWIINDTGHLLEFHEFIK